MVSFYILAGGYTSAIATYLFNNVTSSLSLVSQSPTGTNPSWISLNPLNKSILYATNENWDVGAVQSFTVSSTGSLSSAVNSLSSQGGSPAHLLPLANGQVAVMNYGGGNGIIADTSSDRLHFTSASTVTFSGSPSNPHQTYEHGSELLVPDLGQNKIWRLAQGTNGWAIQGFIPQPSGSGPRHIALSDGSLFTLHELASTLTVQPIPTAPNGTSAITSSVSIVPSDAPAGSSFAAAEILIPPTTKDFPTSYIYTSNRNTGSVADARGDTIAIFSKSSDGQLSLVKQVYTGLNQIRGMQFSQDGQYLIAGSASGSTGVAVFKRVSGGTDLQLVARNTNLPTRTSFVWL